MLQNRYYHSHFANQKKCYITIPKVMQVISRIEVVQLQQLNHFLVHHDWLLCKHQGQSTAHSRNSKHKRFQEEIRQLPPTAAPTSINCQGSHHHLHSLVKIPIFHVDKKKCYDFVQEPSCLLNVFKCHGICGLWFFKKNLNI